MIPVPVDGWLRSALEAAGGCVAACRISGEVHEQHVSLEHGDRRVTFRLPKGPEPLAWDRFTSAWAYIAAECHADTVIDLGADAA